jgi:hypothetical protein
LERGGISRSAFAVVARRRFGSSFVQMEPPSYDKINPVRRVASQSAAAWH